MTLRPRSDHFPRALFQYTELPVEYRSLLEFTPAEGVPHLVVEPIDDIKIHEAGSSRSSPIHVPRTPTPRTKQQEGASNAEIRYAQLEDKLHREKKLSADLEVRIQELENKLSLVKEGVPISTFYKPGMDVIHEVKTRKHANNITDDVEFEKIKPDLLRNGVLSKQEAERLESLGSDKEIMKQLTTVYIARKGAYDSFRDSLKPDYLPIVRDLDNTRVEKYDITDWQKEQNELETLKDIIDRLSTKMDDFTQTIQQQETMLSAINNKIIEEERKKKTDEENSWRQLKQMVGDAKRETTTVIKDGIGDIRNDLRAISRGKSLSSPDVAAGTATEVSFIIQTELEPSEGRVEVNEKLN